MMMKSLHGIGNLLTSADFLASLIIISSPPNKPFPAFLLLETFFFEDSASDRSDSESESSPSLMTTGSCLGGATNDTCENE